MKLVWVAILTLTAVSSLGSTVGDDHGRGCLAVKSSIKVQPTGPGRSAAVARRVEGQPGVPAWPSPMIDEIESPELDDSWSVPLDALGSIPIAWFSWNRPRSTIESPLVDRPQPSTILSVPLRC